MTTENPSEDMSTEPLPHEAPGSSSIEEPSRSKLLPAAITACILIALPVGYLLFHRAGSSAPVTVQAAAPAVAPGIASLEATVRNNPTADNRINLSLAYINAGRPISAIPVLEAVIAADTSNKIAWNNLCVAHTLQKEYKPAIEACQHAVQIDPTYQLAKNNLKWTQDESNKTLKSLATLEQTAPTQRDGKFYIEEGLEFLHVGNNDQAIKSWQRALDVDPKNALAANNIGDAYMLKKQPVTALQWFQKASALDPTFQLAKNNAAWASDEVTKAK